MGDSKHSIDTEDYFEDDQRDVISFNNSEEKLYMSPRGMGLDLSFAAAERKVGGYTPSGVQEESVLVVFDLPDGSQVESQFRMGQTVEFMKSFIESECGMPMRSQTMSLEGKRMMDPLSLLDFQEAKGVSEIIIQVEGTMPQSAKK